MPQGEVGTGRAPRPNQEREGGPCPAEPPPRRALLLCTSVVAVLVAWALLGPRRELQVRSQWQ